MLNIAVLSRGHVQCNIIAQFITLQRKISPYHLVPSSRIRPLATAVAAPLHPALSLASRLMLLVVAPLAYPLSVSSHLCLGLPIVCSIFRLFASFQKTTLICHIFKEIKLMFILLSKSVLDCGIFFVCCSRNGIIPCQIKKFK